MSRTVYYAHFMGIYNTPAESRDVRTLKNLGFEVLNPNTPEIQEEVKDWKAKESFNYPDMFESVFLKRIEGCDVFAFRALPDGRIPSGVYWEMKHAIDHGLSIIELPCGINSRAMDKNETREYLHDIGQR